jgi:hypothetical protein
MSRAIATARLHSIEASPAVRCTCHRSRLACRCSRTSRSGRRTLLDQAEQSFRKALDGARQASMVHGLLEVRGRGCMRERCESAAEACPSQAQAMQQSRSAHLLSIRLEQHGLRSTPRRMSTWSSRNAVVFLSCRSTTSSDSEKLFVVRCATSRAPPDYEELLRVRRSARSATAENRGSGGNRKNKPDPTHLGLDPVANGVESE